MFDKVEISSNGWDTKIFIHEINGYRKHFITCLFDNSDVLMDEWNNVVEETALNIQAELELMIEKMNVYILFFVQGSVGTALRKEIENNRFSSRKIVIENSSDYEDESIKNLIKHKIVFLQSSVKSDDTQESLSEMLTKFDNSMYQVYKDQVKTDIAYVNYTLATERGKNE